MSSAHFRDQKTQEKVIIKKNSFPHLSVFLTSSSPDSFSTYVNTRVWVGIPRASSASGGSCRQSGNQICCRARSCGNILLKCLSTIVLRRVNSGSVTINLSASSLFLKTCAVIVSYYRGPSHSLAGGAGILYCAHRTNWLDVDAVMLSSFSAGQLKHIRKIKTDK